MANLFSNLGLRFKITAIGAIGVLGLTIVAAIYFTSRTIQESVETTMEAAAIARVRAA